MESPDLKTRRCLVAVVMRRSITRPTYEYLNLTINRQLLNKKLLTSVSDVFFANKYQFTLNQGSVSASGVRINDARRIGLNLRYNFGIQKKRNAPVCRILTHWSGIVGRGYLYYLIKGTNYVCSKVTKCVTLLQTVLYEDHYPFSSKRVLSYTCGC
jgi:hypothetical protein